MDERAVGEKNQGNQTQSSKPQYQWCHPFLSLCRNWPLWFLFFISKREMLLALSLGCWKAEQTCLYPPVSLPSVCNTWKSILTSFYKNMLPDSNQPTIGTSTALFSFFLCFLVLPQILFFISMQLFRNLFQGLSRNFPSLLSTLLLIFFFFNKMNTDTKPLRSSSLWTCGMGKLVGRKGQIREHSLWLGMRAWCEGEVFGSSKKQNFKDCVHAS